MKLRTFWAMGMGSGRRPLDPPLRTEKFIKVCLHVTLSLADRGGAGTPPGPNSFDFLQLFFGGNWLNNGFTALFTKPPASQFPAIP